MARRLTIEGTPKQAPYKHVSTHASLEEVQLAVHSYDAFQYVVAYNYGNQGHGKVYRCSSHQHCPKRLRVLEVRDEEEEIPVTYRLAASGTHGTVAITSNRRVGIDLSLRTEVDVLLKAGNHATQCQEILRKKYRNEPAILAKIPHEKQLHNRRLVLVRKGEIAKSTNRAGNRGKRARTRSDESEAEEEGEEDMAREDNPQSYTAMLVEDDNEHEVVEEQPQQKQNEVEDDAECEDAFDKVKLMEEFAAFPARPVFWSVLKKFRYVDDKSGSMVTQWLAGQVIGWETSEHKPVKWVVRFTDGEKRRLGLEELVDMIRASVELGLNVTSRPLEIQMT